MSAAKEEPAEDDVPGYVEIAERSILDFFGSASTGESAALLRIGFGALALWTSLGVWWNLDRYYGDHGLVPWSLVASDAWVRVSAFALAPDARWLLVLHAVVFSVAALLYGLGIFSRAMALVLTYVNLSLQARNPFILNSGDRLFMIALALTALAPLDRRWSLSAAWRARRGEPSLRLGTAMGLRLIQIEIAYVYGASFVSKMSSERWREGLAMRDVLASPVFAEWPRYFGLFPVAAFLTYISIAFEGVFPFFVWFKRWRPWLIALGIAFHVGIDVLMIIPMFSWVMICSYAAFLTDAETQWLADFLSRRVFGRRRVRAPI